MIKGGNRCLFIIFVLILFFLSLECGDNASIDDNKVKTVTQKRFIDIIDSNQKIDCFFRYDSVDADIDLLPDLREKDSSNFEIEYWNKDDLKKFFKVLKFDCLTGNHDSIDLKSIERVLFKGSDKISVEINEVYGKDKMHELIFILYGNKGYSIISYKEIMNNSESKTHE